MAIIENVQKLVYSETAKVFSHKKFSPTNAKGPSESLNRKGFFCGCFLPLY